jgi:hypothetical protein
VTDHYDPARNSFDSWRLAVAACREIGVREGRFAPHSEAERRQAAEGAVAPANLDAVRCA